jgi:hypothetical protein
MNTPVAAALSFLLLVPSFACALERTAGNVIQNQGANSAALHSKAQSAQTQSAIATQTADSARQQAMQALARAQEALARANEVLTRINQVQTTSAGTTNQMNWTIFCAQRGMLFNGSGCVATQFRLQHYAYFGSGNWGGAGEVHAGWHTFCTLAFHHDRTNHWLRIAGGPNAEGKFYWVASRAYPGDMGTSEPQMVCVS